MKNSLLISIVLSIVLSLATSSAQTPILMSAGYAAPTPMLVSPGQIVTIYVSGTKTVLPAQSSTLRATTVPLPTTLGGFSVTVQQGTNTYPAPLLSVVQTSNCAAGTTPSPQCTITGLTIQIPFEIASSLDLPLVSQLPASYLSVNDNSTSSAQFPIAPLTDTVHVLTVCDVQNVIGFLPSPCQAIATHADGTLVSNLAPASAGETIVLYAYGLGPTTPAVSSGQASPTPAPVVLWGPDLTIQFDFRPNAGAAIPYRAPNVVAPQALFVGLTPGQVGLYQINLKLPDVIPPVPPCSVYFSCLGSLVGCLIQSNLTIDIAGVSSVDGAAICVQP